MPQPVREETLWRGSPSATLLLPQFAALIGVVIGLPLFVRFFASTMPDAERASGMISFGWVATGIIALVLVITLLISWIRLRSTRYTITNQRVLIETGVFSTTVDEIDLRYIADSRFFQTLTQRMLGVGNVTLMSSDTNTPTYVFRSVKDPRGVREIVRARAYEISHRQIFTRST